MKKNLTTKKIPLKQEKSNDVLDQLAVAVAVMDKALNLIRINKKAKKLLNFSGQGDFFSLFTNEPAFFSACKTAQSKKSETEISVELSDTKNNLLAKISGTVSGLTIVFEPLNSKMLSTELSEIARLTEAMGDSFMLTDANLNLIDVNKAFCKSIGYDKKKVLKMRITDFDRFLSEKQIRANYKKVDKTGPIIIDTKNLNSAGELVDVEVNIFKVLLDGKEYYANIGRDITTFKKAQLELQKSNQRFEVISKATQDALWEVDLKTGERWGNDIHQKLYGRSRRDAVPTAKEWEKRIHIADRNFIVSLQEECIKSKKENLQCEYWFRTDKKWIFIYDRTHYVYDEKGNLIQAMGSMLDITGQKEAQMQLTNQKNLSESIINALPGIFYLMDKNENILRWNKNFEIVTGYSAEEIRDMKAGHFFQESQKPVLAEKIAEIFQKGWAEMEGDLWTKKGEQKPYYLTGSRTIVENEECVIGTGMDMMEIKKAEQKLNQMEKKIANQKVLEQKKISQAIIAAQERERNHIGRELHDNVNQLLAGTRLYLTMGSKKSDEVAEVVKYPIELLDSGINEIRSLTHRHISPAKDMSLKQLVETQVQLLKAADINVKLFFDIDNDIYDNLRINIYRILQEQVNNLLKHSEASNVDISMTFENCSININTKDDGKGFNTEVTRDGIGLSNIYNRVDAYDGTMKIVSEPGKGCLISISIPVKDCEGK